jgi:hypothetical protein
MLQFGGKRNVIKKEDEKIKKYKELTKKYSASGM